ncbi:ABC transporter permease [Williamsia soli]|uniref:ABC transporter permease n=1 Tax=Williamsia soli TaxID=364929 RepID=UPI001A9F4B63|nr:ABC transporter permease [Williamsia soli]
MSEITTDAARTGSHPASGGDTPQRLKPPKKKVALTSQLSKLSGPLLLLLLIAVFGVLTPDTFLTLANARSILTSQAVVGIVALGLLFPLAAGAFDLSAAQNLGFSAVVVGYLIVEAGLPVPLAIVVTLAVGAIVGAVNGTLVAVIGIDSFIATLGTTSLLLAGSQVVANGAYIGPIGDSFTKLSSGTILGVPITVLYVIVLAVVAWYVLEHSPLGRRIYATGANRDAASLSGVATSRIVFGTFVVSGVFASAAGILLASTLGAVSETMGPEYLLPAFAAVFLGTTLLKRGRFNVGGTLLAILLLGTGVQGLQLLGGPVWVIALFNGLALIASVGAGLTVQRAQARRAVRRAAQTARRSGDVATT